MQGVDPLVSYRSWLGTATGVFTAWYIVFLLPVRSYRLLRGLADVGHTVVPLFPSVSPASIRAILGSIGTYGLWVTVGLFFVGLALFMAQSDA